MKRDMDLVRAILLEMEKQPMDGPDEMLQFDGFDQDSVIYHVMLMSEAGLIEAIDGGSYGEIYWLPVRLTWQGHEFLEAVRQPEQWIHLKSIMIKLGGFVFDVAKPLAIEWMKQQADLNP